jgi:hypothetical protein
MGAAALIGGVWLIQNAASKGAPPPRPKTVAVQAKAQPVPTTPLDTDVAMARAVSAANDSLASRPVADTAPTAVAPIVATPTVVASAAEPKRETAPKADVRSAEHAPKRPASRWVRSVSRHWVVIRSGASKGSRIIASIGPNSRVELGESRGDWRRIRAKGINGWVEPRSSFEVVASR